MLSRHPAARGALPAGFLIRRARAAPPALSLAPILRASSAAMSFFFNSTIVSLSRFVSTRNVSVSSLASCVFLRTSRASAFFNASSARVSRSRVSRALCFFLSSAMYVADWSASSPVLRARSRARRGGRSTKKPLVFPGVSLLTPTQRARTRTRRVAPRRRRATRRRFLFFSPTGRSRRSLSPSRFRLSSSRSRLASSRSRASVSTFSDIASSAALASSAAAAGDGHLGTQRTDRRGGVVGVFSRKGWASFFVSLLLLRDRRHGDRRRPARFGTPRRLEVGVGSSGSARPPRRPGRHRRVRLGLGHLPRRVTARHGRLLDGGRRRVDFRRFRRLGGFVVPNRSFVRGRRLLRGRGRGRLEVFQP